jgi:hypothetical protein
MSEAPERHPAIPAAAVWNEEIQQWELGALDGSGQKTGEHRSFRPDGSLYLRCAYQAGRREGAFAYYHPDGKLAREGTCVGGEVDGVLTAYASDLPDAEPLRSCCVPQGAARLRAEYIRGELQVERFLDTEDRVLLSDGRVRPSVPAGLPETAEYEEFGQRWSVGPGPRATSGLWRAYTEDGRLDEETECDEGRKIFSRLYGRDGQPRQEAHFDLEGKRHGAYRRRFVEGDESPYLDARIAEERGAFHQGEAVGRWGFFDAAGAPVRAVERGQPFREEELGAPAFQDAPRSAEAWSALADAAMAEGRPREAVCASARAAAAAGQVDELVAFLARHTVALAPEAAAALADEATQPSAGGVGVALSALVAGGEPVKLLRAIAGGLRGAPRAALDLVEAAVLLAPQQRMTYLTRALIRLDLGDQPGMLADAERVAGESEEAAQFVRDYARLLFPEWGFSPLREHPEGEIEGMPAAPGQPLEAIRHNIQVYATRLLVLREAAQRRVARTPAPAWLPPDLGALLPDGPLELRRYTGSITDETDEGLETVEVQIDETLDAGKADLPVLMREARAQWAGLTWLCWSAGLTRVALPDRLEPPAAFAAAAGMAMTRFFRARDVLETNGLRSLNAGVPGFVWEGLDIDGMPRHFVQMAADEYQELRALFLWLVSPENLSPFQSDLRQIG